MHVASIFKASPEEQPFYHASPNAVWTGARILKVERVENGSQLDGGVQPYYTSLQRSVEAQGMDFELGVHTRWAFHGTEAVDSIVSDPISGFQPLTAGSRLDPCWGAGTYFA